MNSQHTNHSKSVAAAKWQREMTNEMTLTHHQDTHTNNSNKHITTGTGKRPYTAALRETLSLLAQHGSSWRRHHRVECTIHWTFATPKAPAVVLLQRYATQRMTNGSPGLNDEMARTVSLDMRTGSTTVKRSRTTHQEQPPDGRRSTGFTTSPPCCHVVYNNNNICIRRFSVAYHSVIFVLWSRGWEEGE